jgi:host factor-I protein
MNRSQGNLQDAYLNVARRDNVGVTVYLTSGHQLRGTIKAFDAFTVLLESAGRPPQLVYKHAIASINPVRAVRYSGPPPTDSDDENISRPESEEVDG